MVSSINSIRLWTQQTALKAFNEASSEKENAASNFPLGSLADMLYGDTQDEDGDDTALSSLITRLQQQAMTGGVAPGEEADGSVEDISSNAFMKALQQKIDALAANPDTEAMAEAMQAALKAGTLTVTDIVAGEQITGRDLSEKAGTSGTTGSAGTEPSGDITPVESSDWSTYLREHLMRDPYGKYLRNDDTSHIDKVSGASSYFGMVGDTYHYLSWTAPKTAPDVTIQI